eukprot:357208-Chlamydomonas_euryale.AAC.8
MAAGAVRTAHSDCLAACSSSRDVATAATSTGGCPAWQGEEGSAGHTLPSREAHGRVLSRPFRLWASGKRRYLLVQRSWVRFLRPSPVQSALENFFRPLCLPFLSAPGGR